MKKKKRLYSCKQVTTSFLEFQRINTLQTLLQDANSQHFRQSSFQLQSLAVGSMVKPLNDSIIDHFKKLK